MKKLYAIFFILMLPSVSSAGVLYESVSTTEISPENVAVTVEGFDCDTKIPLGETVEYIDIYLSSTIGADARLYFWSDTYAQDTWTDPVSVGVAGWYRFLYDDIQPFDQMCRDSGFGFEIDTVGGALFNSYGSTDTSEYTLDCRNNGCGTISTLAIVFGNNSPVSIPSSFHEEYLTASQAGFASTTGFTMQSGVGFASENFLMLILGSGLATLMELIWWIIGIIVIYLVIRFSYRAWRGNGVTHEKPKYREPKKRSRNTRKKKERKKGHRHKKRG